MQSLNRRPRRLRNSAQIRDLVAETNLSPNDFIVPIFVEDGKNIQTKIASMPGYYRRSLDLTLVKLKQLFEMGLKTYLLFVKVEDNLKDNTGKASLNPHGLMQKAIMEIKERFPDCVLMTDVALDPYSIYGHDGIVQDNLIMNDLTVEILAQMAISHAQAGADFVAPSDMMDGRIGVIRKKLDEHGFTDISVMSYAAKFASSLYGPFRNALDSAPGFGDKKTYQMDYRNKKEALLECKLDLDQGADILMIKPAGFYLDVIQEVSNNFHIPIAAYQVSGEYSMIYAAANNGWIDLDEGMMESLYSIKRAGANFIASYFAEEAVQILHTR